MSILEVQIKERLFTLVGHRKAMIKINRASMEIVKHVFMPRHFEFAAYQRYPGVFKARTRKYAKWKKRVVGHQMPNVLSGELKYQVLVNSQPTSTQYGGRFYAKFGSRGQFMSGPRKGLFYKRALPDERRREIEYVSPEEQRALAQWIARTYVKIVNLPENEWAVLETPVKFDVNET